MNNNGSIFAPISIYDVQRVLGNPSPDLGTLCRDSHINLWARYKPVQYPGFPVRFQSSDAAFNAKTGLNVGTMIDLPSQVAAWSDLSIGYDRPLGTLNSPYRLTDFVRYNHYAQKPCEIIWRTSFKEDTGFGCAVSIYDRSSSEETEYISFTDLMNEITGYGSFKSGEKRLCLAVYNEAASETDPIFYFFSEKFSTAGSSGSWSVSVNMGNTSFKNQLTTSKTYKFKVMIVSNHPYLETIPSGGVRYVWELGCSPSQMSYMEGTQQPIQAMCLALEHDIDVTSVVYQQASVITDLTYYLDWMSVEKWGNLVQSGNYDILCTRLYLPTITVRTPTAMNQTAQYQMRVAYSGGLSGTGIFRPTQRSGNDYYEIEQQPSTSLSELALTPWLEAGDVLHTTETDGQGNTIEVYEFDFPNNIFTILSQTAEQTENENSGEFLFWDLVSDFTLSFNLYYKASSTSNEILVRSIDVTYEVAQNEGHVTDIIWTQN